MKGTMQHPTFDLMVTPGRAPTDQRCQKRMLVDEQWRLATKDKSPKSIQPTEEDRGSTRLCTKRKLQAGWGWIVAEA
jgi:hypothetical protein